MNQENLIKYYNKFNEDKRLNSRHGKIEFITTTNYLDKFLKPHSKILDVGAGCGIYAEYLKNNNHEVKCVELVKHNAKTIEKKGLDVILGNALDLSYFSDETFDAVLLFGPLYHLISEEDKIKCLNEAKRVLKKDGLIFISYIMNDYALIKHGFIQRFILKEKDKIDNDFKILSNPTDLYSYIKIKDINILNQKANLKRVKMINQTGLANYLRTYFNKLNEEEFSLLVKYHLSVCEDETMFGYASHLLDIVKK